MSLKPRSAPGAERVKTFADYVGTAVPLDPFLGAVLDVYRENKKTAKLSGMEADDDDYVVVGSFRAHLFECVRRAWCRRSGQGFARFPFAEDYVVRFYKLAKELSAKERNLVFNKVAQEELDDVT